MKNLIYFIYTLQRFWLTLLNYYCYHKQEHKYRDNFNLTEAEKKQIGKRNSKSRFKSLWISYCISWNNSKSWQEFMKILNRHKSHFIGIRQVKEYETNTYTKFHFLWQYILQVSMTFTVLGWTIMLIRAIS